MHKFCLGKGKGWRMVVMDVVWLGCVLMGVKDGGLVGYSWGRRWWVVINVM